MSQSKRKFVSIWLIVPGLVMAFHCVIVAQTGAISGTIQSINGELIAHANVILVGTEYGAMSLVDGRFRIDRVPKGTYTVKVLTMGFKTVEKENVRVSHRDTGVWLVLEPTVVATTQKIVVTAERLPRPSASRRLEYDDVDDILEAVALRAGIRKPGREMRL